MYKRSWRAVASTFLGVGVFLLIVPSIVIGPEFNGQCLSMWFERILSPYFVHEVVSPQEVNQSLAGVFSRLFTENRGVDPRGYGGTRFSLNVLALPPALATRIVKGLAMGLVGLLAVFCRTKTTRRDDPRLLGEFALVVLTMLFVSERSWKHHFVTLVLPYSYLTYRMMLAPRFSRLRWTLAGSLLLSALLMLSTSTEIGGWFARGQGHKVAQFFGMFFWAGLVLYAATAWRVLVEGRDETWTAREPSSGPGAATADAGEIQGRTHTIPAPHLGISTARARSIGS